jgi:hypothetical protein
MTLVLTELTNAGIAMAADSAITKMDSRGNIAEVDERGWLKLLTAPRIQAAVSYWGILSAITPERFDDWLARIIADGSYPDLSTFADNLTTELNRACKNKPLLQGELAGVHVAGYAIWPTGAASPFAHNAPIVNGHS